MSYSSPCSWECLAQGSAQEVSFTWLLKEEMFLNEPGSYQLSGLLMWYFCQDIVNVFGVMHSHFLKLKQKSFLI